MWETNQRLKSDISGMDLCEAYWREVGRPMIERRFPTLIPRMAAGLVGEGSECFGFDDAISRDHDWGPSFCVWIRDNEFALFGQELAAAYDELPLEFRGMTFAFRREQAQGRRGFIPINLFYERFLRRPDAPTTNIDWLRLPESYLAVATNGKVFEDNLGEFTAVREALLAFYPEDVRKKKLAACLLTMAQTGQANFCRMMARFDTVAAEMCRHQFIESACKAMYLLNRRYAPYYKWMWRGLVGQERLADVPELLRELAAMSLDTSNWTDACCNVSSCGPNMKDPAVALIERICGRFIEELEVQDLAHEEDSYLEFHAYAVQESIADPQLRNLPVPVGL